MDFAGAPASDAPTVRLSTGTLAGTRIGPVQRFLGIPYAAPPVGALRWRAPRPATAWSGTRTATSFGPSALQAVVPEGFGPWTREYVVQGGVSEDCLYLNVWAPADPPETPLPVMVWIHGGGFCQGSGSVAVYDGARLAARGIVVVTINYRLGPLGFLAHPDLSRASPPGEATNFGLQDQVAALRWVRDHIAAFGGDASAVTIAGQSAGALSVHLLVASARARGLFQRAIAHSGPPDLMRLQTHAEAQEDGLAFARELGATDLEALRRVPVEALTGATPPGPRFMPVVDGDWVKAWPPHGEHSGLDNVPMLVGHTADEHSALDPAYRTADAEALAGLLRQYYGDGASQWSAHYGQVAGQTAATAYQEATRDRWLAALWHWADRRVAALTAPVYVHQFDHVEPGEGAEQFGAFHSADLPYFFDMLEAVPWRPFTDADRRVASQASTYWVNFVRHGDPNGIDQPTWPPLVPSSPVLLRIGSTTTAAPMFPPATLDLLHQHLRDGGSLRIF